MEDNLKYWVALNIVLNEDLKAVKKIRERVPNIRELFDTSLRGLKALGLDEETAAVLSSPKTLHKAEKDIEKIAKKKYAILSIEDGNYPVYLRESFDPPCVLYCAGNAEELAEPSVSIVGARKPTPYGRAVAENLAFDLASRGMTVVSGLARGIDSTAHWGALRGGKTVAVMGSGLDVIYPKENRMLFEKITERGAVITEFPLKSPPLGYHFPMRNRIISGLSLAVVVIEATKKSGSLITARLALEQNREVMAVPGNTTSELSRGTNWLVKTGAKLVERWEDVAEELPPPLRDRLLSQTEEKASKALPSINPDEEKVLSVLKIDELTPVDDLVEKTEFSVSEILTLSLQLELKGYIHQSPGKYFQRKI
ncbi:MAG: DNA-processing protein DprA [Candidatus Aminicenantes bacterium]